MASKDACLYDTDSDHYDVPIDVQIIRDMSKFLVCRIDGVELLPCFKQNLFTTKEIQDITYESVERDRSKAVFTLLDMLIRKPDGWLEQLLMALEHNRLQGRYEDVALRLRKDMKCTGCFPLDEEQTCTKDLWTRSENDSLPSFCLPRTDPYPHLETPNPSPILNNLSNQATCEKKVLCEKTLEQEKKSKWKTSSNDVNIDLNKKVSLHSKNIAQTSLKEKQLKEHIYVDLTKALASEGTGISSNLPLDEEQTCTKEPWTRSDNDSLPSFCLPRTDPYPHLETPNPSPILNNLSNQATCEKKVLVGSGANCLRSALMRKKDNRLNVLNFCPRDYQKELAIPATEGKNCIICSPKCTGKTYVAIMVTKIHLYENKGSRAKVLVVVPFIDLLQQVYRDFRSHLPLYQLGTRTGSSPSKEPLKALIDGNDIVIVTADILKNALRDDTRLSDLSLLVFEGCHHTMKDHAYHYIMENYISEKQSASSGKLPQVLALTASPGAGKNPSETNVRDHILRLCANLDADRFVTVQDNQESLLHWTPTPSRRRIKIEKRNQNPLKAILTKWMIFVEQRFDLTNTCEKSTQEYESFMVEKRQLIARRDAQDARVCDHLIMLNKALILTDIVRMADGVKLIQRTYDQIEPQGDIEKWLHQIYAKNIQGLKDVASQENSYPNPKLVELRSVILSHEQSSEQMSDQMRVIVFVKTKEITQAILEWMKDDERLKKFNPSSFTGASVDVEKGGMSKQLQRDVLAAFKNGDHQILISTSVGEHEIEIPECSLSIRYNHVTNEISMIQSRGCVRQKEGKEVILGERDTLEKDSRNVLLETAMSKVMKEVTAMSTEELRALTNRIQQNDLDERRHKNERQRQLENSHQADDVKLYCKGTNSKECDVFVCMVSDIRIYRKTNYILVEDKYKDLMNFVKHHDKQKVSKNIKKIFCKKCQQDWGNTVRRYPCLKISSFKFEINGGIQVFKQWGKVPCKMQDF